MFVYGTMGQVDENELADRIAKEIIADIENYVDDQLRKYNKYTLNAVQKASDVDDSTAKFFNLISLLKDVSVLGRKLLEAAPQFESLRSVTTPSSASSQDRKSFFSQKSKSGKGLGLDEEDATSEDLLAALIESCSSDDFLVLSSSLDSIAVKDMIVTALILIKSHECFTLSHDIQGVVMVLRRTKFLILNILAPKNQMELITKLLTSIGRYNEMNYVFDLFRDRNQFEILLSKGVEKTPELRIALFNYVKKNPEFYALVTLNFSMFREIAESLEASALKRLDKVIQSSKKGKKKIGVTSGSRTPDVSGREVSNAATVAGSSKSNHLTPSSTASNNKVTSNKPLYSKDSLNLCLVELVDASDCFAKAGCYKRSNNCERKAKLIALQLAILSSETNVLDLQQSELNDLIVDFESFSEAYILAEAYDYHLAWRQALFNNVILQQHRQSSSGATYLNEFCGKCDLSSVLVLELVFLYKQYLANNHLSQEASLKLANSMKMVLARLADVELRCKIYTQLNFSHAKEELLKNPSVWAHLKDLKLV